MQELDGKAAANEFVLGLVDLAHATRAEQAHQAVLAAQEFSYARVGRALAFAHRNSPGAGAADGTVQFDPSAAVFCDAVVVRSILEGIRPH